MWKTLARNDYVCKKLAKNVDFATDLKDSCTICFSCWLGNTYFNINLFKLVSWHLIVLLWLFYVRTKQNFLQHWFDENDTPISIVLINVSTSNISKWVKIVYFDTLVFDRFYVSLNIEAISQSNKATKTGFQMECSLKFFGISSPLKFLPETFVETSILAKIAHSLVPYFQTFRGATEVANSRVSQLCCPCCVDFFAAALILWETLSLNISKKI